MRDDELGDECDRVPADGGGLVLKVADGVLDDGWALGGKLVILGAGRMSVRESLRDE